MKRKEKQLKEGEQAAETIPTRYQHMTAEEQYASFKEECEEKVRVEMVRKATKDSVKVSTWPESADKTRRVERLEKLPGYFPGKKWYSEQKPEEVKPLIDHTTGQIGVFGSAPDPPGPKKGPKGPFWGHPRKKRDRQARSQRNFGRLTPWGF